MTVILFLLKIIGIVILAVLGLLLLVLAVVLFVPLRYRICANLGSDETDDDKSPEQAAIDEEDRREGDSDKMQADVLARVHWLLYFLGIEVSYRDGRPDAYLRILFWRKKLLNNEEAQEDEEEFEEDAKTVAEDAAEEAAKPPEEAAKPPKGAARSSESSESAAKEEASREKALADSTGKESTKQLESVSREKQTVPVDADKRQKDSENEKKRSEKGPSKVTETPDTEKEESSNGIIARIRKLWNDFSNFRRKLNRMVEDERNRRAVSHLKAELIHLLQVIRPRKLSIDMEFSLGSPDLTGEVLGVCAWFPISYQSGNHLTPDFEADAAYAKGNVDAKGRIYLFQLLFAALRILFDKDCKRMYRMFKKYFG